jgi:hypothetical protein
MVRAAIILTARARSVVPLDLDRRVVDAEFGARAGDVGEGIGVGRGAVHAQRRLAVADGPYVQVVDVPHAGNVRDGIVHPLPVDVRWDLLQENRDGTPQDAEGVVQYQNAEQQGEDGIDDVILWFPPDAQAPDEDRHALGQVGHDVQICGPQIHVPLVALVCVMLGIAVVVVIVVVVVPIRVHCLQRSRLVVHVMMLVAVTMTGGRSIAVWVVMAVGGMIALVAAIMAVLMMMMMVILLLVVADVGMVIAFTVVVGMIMSVRR